MHIERFRWGGWQLTLPGLVISRSVGVFWFRVFGWGLRFTHRMEWLFSDRNRLGCLRVGPISIALLKR